MTALYDPDADLDAATGFRHHQVFMPRIIFFAFCFISTLVGVALGMSVRLAGRPADVRESVPSVVQQSPIVLPSCWRESTTHNELTGESVTTRRVCK